MFHVFARVRFLCDHANLLAMRPTTVFTRSLLETIFNILYRISHIQVFFDSDNSSRAISKSYQTCEIPMPPAKAKMATRTGKCWTQWLCPFKFFYFKILRSCNLKFPCVKNYSAHVINCARKLLDWWTWRELPTAHSPYSHCSASLVKATARFDRSARQHPSSSS